MVKIVRFMDVIPVGDSRRLSICYTGFPSRGLKRRKGCWWAGITGDSVS